MKTNLHRTLILSCTLVAVSGCGKNETEVYFPLADGIVWQYAITQKTAGAPYHYKHLVMNLDDEKLEGQVVFPRRDLKGSLVYYRANDHGITRYASRNGEELRLDQPDNYLIRLPLSVGTEWKVETRPYLTEKTLKEINDMQNSMPAMSLTQPLTMHYRIESINEKVEVPAGRYFQCLKVRGSGSCSFSTVGGFDRNLIVDVEHIDWYCPGIGLVKTERRETNQNGVLKASEYISALERIETEI